MPSDPKPQLHGSQLQTLYRCGEQFRRRYPDLSHPERGEKISPGIALVVGTATHKAVGANLTYKARRGHLMRLERVLDTARDEVVAAWGREGIRLLPEERCQGERKLKGQAIDQTIELVREHSVVLAPRLLPRRDGVNWKWVINVQGYPFDLAGEADLLEVGARIRELKTWGQNKGQREADASEQLSIYALAHQVHFKRLPTKVFIDAVLKYKTPVVKVFSSVRDQKDMKVTLARFARACTVIQSGNFTPASQSDWWCSKKWCGYAPTCSFFRGRVTVGASNGR